MALFDTIDTLSAPRNPFLTEGDYELEFLAANTGRNFKDKKEHFKVTARVVSSSGPAALPAGTQVTIMIMEDTQFNYHVKDIRALVAAIVDEPEVKVTKATVQQLLSEDNPAAGQKFKARRGRFLSNKGVAFMGTVYAGESGVLAPLASAEQVAAAEATAKPSKRR